MTASSPLIGHKTQRQQFWKCRMLDSSRLEGVALCREAAGSSNLRFESAEGSVERAISLKQMEHRIMLDDPASQRPVVGERGVTADTVSKLCQKGYLSEAVEALGVLVQMHCCVSKALFYAVLRKCMVKKDLALGRRVHALAVREGYQSDTFLGNHILRMYASHGRLEAAMDVFTMVVNPDAFTWSAMISAHVKHGRNKQAIELYHRMRRSGVKPDGHVLVAALQACAKGADLRTGQQVHAYVLACGIEPDLFVCNGLVDMYAKCGSLEEAQGVFDGLGRKDVVTWNAMLAAYSHQGRGQEALHIYSAMEEEGLVAPDSKTFVSLLQACASLGTPALEKGKEFHADIRERGHEADMFVASSLVNMYTKCGSIEDAQDVFNGLSQKGVVAWTAMISGYSQQGKGQEALNLHSAMQDEGIAVPDSVTYVCLLQACAIVGAPALERGKQLHVQIRQRGLQADVLANCLVNMYAKCGSLEEAQRVFDGLDKKCVVTWTALIAGYSQQGMGQEALRLYSCMQEESIIVPDPVTFVCLLQACASVGPPALEEGKQLHRLINERGHQADVFVSNSLVNMYSKCGSLKLAQIVFDGLRQKDVVTWTALIAGYSQQGMGQEALSIYRAMQDDGLAAPNSVTFVCLLQACASVGTSALEMGKLLHAQLREQGHQVDVFVANSLVTMYAKCGSLEDAQGMFDGLDGKDVVTWNSMIAGYCQQGMGQEALRVYSAMQEECMAEPDPVTFLCVLQACAKVGTRALEMGKQLHATIRERGLQTEVFIANSLVDMYAKCGSIEDARRVFDGLAQRDVVTWNAMIAGYSQQGLGQEALHLYRAMQEEGIAVADGITFACLLQACASMGTLGLEKGKHIHAQLRERSTHDTRVANSLVNMYAKCGTLDEARRVFDELDQKDAVTWNAMIAGYFQQGLGEEALRLYSAMQDEGISVPDAATFVSLLLACANVAALHLGRLLHLQIEERGLETDPCVAGSLINMYGKSGSMADAQLVFDALPKRDLIAWSALISGYAYQGDTNVVFDLIQRMREDGIEPDGITFLSVLKVCSHSGLVDEGREHFETMRKQYGIPPLVEHYTCMVSLLGRAGHLDEALALVRTMSVLPTVSIWHTLLSVCGKWSNVEVGRHALHQALKLDNNDAAAYVLMSNIYSGAQMWEEAEEMQARRIGIGAWKEPGQSWWTDLDGHVHSFVVRDTKHPNSTHADLRL